MINPWHSSFFPAGVTHAFRSRQARMTFEGVGAFGAVTELSVLAQKLKSGITGPEPGAPSSKSTIDWWCWNAPGFKDCHALAFQAAQGICQAGGLSNDPVCLTTNSDKLAKERCGCPASPPEGSSAEGDGNTNLLIGIVAFGLIAFLWPDTKKKGAST